MPSGRYKFSRSSRSVEGFFSKNTSSTDALNALLVWSSNRSERMYDVITDNDALLFAKLSWSEGDSKAGPDLDDACAKFGVERSYEGP
ncbi:hypothetical protein [Aromatoleum evansii]|uniref:hypothetical protein n=1 Tax=Aromatoleum evansii TaxID=59406 RepID=UPI00145E79CF|nr:hypothetical protein [Aromatoleum evansii]NMG31272.1 hypothetical protein [Aromatoleum evansii]